MNPSEIRENQFRGEFSNFIPIVYVPMTSKNEQCDIKTNISVMLIYLNYFCKKINVIIILGFK